MRLELLEQMQFHCNEIDRLTDHEINRRVEADRAKETGECDPLPRED